MAHIVISVASLKGLLFASFELASRLIAEGHNITFMCPIIVKDLIESEGFTCSEVPEINFKNKFSISKHTSWISKLKAHFFDHDLTYDRLKKQLHIDVYKASLIKLKPDLVICDLQQHEIILTLVHLNIPFKLLSPWFNMQRISGIPPFRSKIIPKNNSLKHRMEIEMAWLKLNAKIYARYAVDIIQFKNYRRSTIKRYAREVGFTFRNLINRNFPSYYIYNSIPTISLTMKEMEYGQKMSCQMIYVGMMVYDNRIDQIYSLEDEYRMLALFDQKKNDNKKLIYCGMGSMVKGNIPFTKKLIEAVKNEPDWILIISLGTHLSKTDFANIPNNVHLFDWVSQTTLLKHVDCCINHAGINTINECIVNNVPMLIYSWHMADQDGNAARMAYYNLAMVRQMEKDTSEDVNASLKILFANADRYISRLKQYSELHQRYQTIDLTQLMEIEVV